MTFFAHTNWQLAGNRGNLASHDWLGVVSVCDLSVGLFVNQRACVSSWSHTDKLLEIIALPDWEVTLGLKTSDGPVEHVKIRMTEENRNLLRK